MYKTIAEEEWQRELDLFLEGFQPGWRNPKELQNEEVCPLDICR